jgi:hypothetical protein
VLLNPQDISSKHFTAGFEKIALLPALGRGLAMGAKFLGRGSLGLGKRMVGTMKDGKFKFSPGRTFGTAMLGMEASDAASKTMDASRRMRQIGNPNRMNGMGMQNLPRHTNVQQGLT